MKTKTIFLIFLTLLMLGCTSEDETNNNDENPTTQNPSNEDYSHDVVDKSLIITDLYFLTGINASRIQMDNKDANYPGTDRLPKLGKTTLSQHVGANPYSAVCISISGQILPASGQTLDMDNDVNFGAEYVIITLIDPDNVPDDVMPNARIERSIDLSYQPNGVQGQDAFGNGIVSIKSGQFKITALIDGVLGTTSTGENVNSVEFTYQANAYALNYHADNAIVTKNSGGTLNVPLLINQIFHQDAIDVHIVETLNSSPIYQTLQRTYPYQE